MPLHKIIDQVKQYLEDHKGLTDYFIGGGIGLGTGVSHYWDHLMQDENLYKTIDGIVNTCLHTVIGAVLLWALHKYVFKTKKEDDRKA
jgi:tRNA U34 2-thiouridine synthase MnmA/TrmU